MDVLDLVSLLSTILGILGALSGGYFFFSSRVRKEFASQRDWAHLKRDYESMSKTLASELEQLDANHAQILREISELRAYLQAFINLQKENK